MTANRYTRPLPSSAALVLIDVQRDFLDLPSDDAPMPVAGTCAAIPAMAKLAKAFRERLPPIVHVIRLYQSDGSNVDRVRRQSIERGARIAVPGSAGSQIAAELLPNVVELDHELLLAGGFQRVGATEHVMYKPRWGAFFKTGLDRHLRESGSDTLVFAGCNFPNCPPCVDLRGIRTRLPDCPGFGRDLRLVRPGCRRMPCHRSESLGVVGDTGLAGALAAR